MKKVLFILSLILVANFSYAQPPEIQLDLFSSPYNNPIDILNCGDSRIFIVEQKGYIFICDSAGNKNPASFLDIHLKVTQSGGERGLLGMAFHPDYLNNGYFFLYYTKSSNGDLIIARYAVDPLNPDLADPNSEDIVIDIPHPTYSNHNGGCLKFGPDGYLYAGTGDGGSGGDPNENAQNPLKYLGKMLRFDVNVDSGYVVPPDNPFVNDPAYYPEIWAIGVRNPWRFSFDRLTHELWIGDVGQDEWEEVDYIAGIDTGGQNYGWDCYEGTHNFEPNNCNGAGPVTWPVYEYPHTSGGNGDCSENGGYVYRGCQYLNMYGRYIFADYCSGKFRCITKNADGTFTTDLAGDELISSDEYNFASFGEDRHGELYAAAITSGRIYHVTDISAASSAIIIEAINDTAICLGEVLHALTGDGLSYEWNENGVAIPGATGSSYQPVSVGEYSVNVTNAEGCVTLSQSIGVLDAPAADLTALEPTYCVYLTSVLLAGTPAGGTFSGDGVNADTFNPYAAGMGSHTIYYSATGANGCVGVDSQIVMVVECTGLNSDWDHAGVSIFPNPANEELNILMKDTDAVLQEFSLWNVAGQSLFHFTKDQISDGSSAIHLDTRILSEGVYVLKIISGTNSIFYKIVIHH